MKHPFTIARQLPALVTFAAVVEHEGFGAAARALGVSTSAVSQAVRGLEAELGTTLLARTSRRVAVTDAGRALYDAAAPGLSDALAALAGAPGAGDSAVGELRVTLPTSAVDAVWTPIAARLRELAPALRLDVSVDDRVVDIVDLGIDAGFRLDESLRKDMVSVRASAPFRFVLVASPAYLARAGTPRSPEDLRDHAGVAFRFPTAGTVYIWELERNGDARRVHAPWALTVNNAVALRAAARAGLGLAYLDEPYVAEDLAAGALRIVLDDWSPRVDGWFLYFPLKAQRLPKLRALIDATRACQPSEGAHGCVERFEERRPARWCAGGVASRRAQGDEKVDGAWLEGAVSEFIRTTFNDL